MTDLRESGSHACIAGPHDQGTDPSCPQCASATESTVRALLRRLRFAPEHSAGASRYRDGAWRHNGCTRCDIEAAVDVALRGGVGR